MKLKQRIERLIEALKIHNKAFEKPEIKVIIDAGHGGWDWGLKVAGKPNKGYNGIMEKDINLEMAMRLGWLCARHNIGYMLTRWGDRFISLRDRCKIANMSPATLFLSIHCNYAPGKANVRGMETYYCGGSAKGKELANTCHKYIRELKYTRDREVKDNSSFYVLKNTRMPAVLLELGFLQNKQDATYLNKPDNQMLVCTKILKFLKEVVL